MLILGPYAGQLQDDGENLELQKPDNPNTNGFVPYVVVEAVRYNDRAPWPPAADGSGMSLQRLRASAYGNEPPGCGHAVAVRNPTPILSPRHARRAIVE